MDSLLSVIRKHWGYDSFRPLQREAMTAAMESQDSLTVLPTGGGKSLCYQAPAVHRDGMAVVVSPLIALMKDQVDALSECGVPAAYVNSSLTAQERMEVAGRVRRGELKMLFAAPERLVQQRTIEFLADVELSFIAIDEAHCISNWGHDFRPEYRRLSDLRQAFPDISIHAFTATATERVRRDIGEQLKLKAPRILVGSFDRPNLLYRVERRHDVIGQIREVIDRHPNESGIVYCISRSSVEETASTLSSLGYRTLPYHAGLEPDRRKANQEAFIDEKTDIIVATVAFGMGIDKSNVRYVVHAEMPRSIEAYQQESGRAGRDGLEAECSLIYSGRDTSTWEFLINQSENEDNRVTSLQALGRMESFCFSSVCRHRQLVGHFGQQLEKENCGACDVCLNEIESLQDPLVLAQKIISSIYRQEQRYGAEYTSLVLRGSKSKKVLTNGHDQLSTYGLLKDESERDLRGWIDQLVAQGLLRRSGEYSVLVITDTGFQLLKGELTPQLTRPKTRRQAASATHKWEGVDRGLFENLRQMRMDIAAERGVPPYVIFGDMTLRELARFRPTRAGDLLQIYGIGQQKQAEFGGTVIERITEYCLEDDLVTNLPISDTNRTARKVPPDSFRRR
ncbi:MAG: DNA helicase RecQ [Fuerstiella sp.]|jgi:ATP-dependent DNA helicase RecQ|nr:DNA helicase RecQ [Fuerstiella sp.]